MESYKFSGNDTRLKGPPTILSQKFVFQQMTVERKNAFRTSVMAIRVRYCMVMEVRPFVYVLSYTSATIFITSQCVVLNKQAS